MNVRKQKVLGASGPFIAFFLFFCCCFVTVIKFRSAMGTGIFAGDFFFLGGCVTRKMNSSCRFGDWLPSTGSVLITFGRASSRFTSSPAPTSYAFLTMQISHKAYLKPLLHAAKYPTTAVNGVFLADASQTVDAVPFFHFWNTLSPMLEVAMTQVPFFTLTLCSSSRMEPLEPRFISGKDAYMLAKIPYLRVMKEKT